MSATVSDVARSVGCSNATVSRVLNNIGQVRPELRDAVLTAMKQLNYIPRPSAPPAPEERAANGRETGVVELIMFNDQPFERLTYDNAALKIAPLSDFPPEEQLSESNWLSNSFYRSIVDGVIYEAPEWNFKTTVHVRKDLSDPHFIEQLNRSDKTGVLLAGMYTPQLAQFVKSCAHPLVLIDLILDTAGASAPVVTFDNMDGISAAFEHLYALGHRQIGYLAGPLETRAYQERLNAFRCKMSEKNLDVRDDWIYIGPPHMAPTAAWSRQVLKRKRPTAFMCANDFMAIALIQSAQELGISVPGKLSVVGFDDLVPAALATPPLTTVRTPAFEVGRQAIQQLFLQIKLGARRSRRSSMVRLPLDLVLRASTAAPHG